MGKEMKFQNICRSQPGAKVSRFVQSYPLLLVLTSFQHKECQNLGQIFNTMVSGWRSLEGKYSNFFINHSETVIISKITGFTRQKEIALYTKKAVGVVGRPSATSNRYSFSREVKRLFQNMDSTGDGAINLEEPPGEDPEERW